MRVINGTPKTITPSGSETESLLDVADAEARRPKSPRGDMLRPHKSHEHVKLRSPDVLSLRAHKSHDEEIHLRRSDDVIDTERPRAPFLEEMSSERLARIIQEHSNHTYGSVAGSLQSLKQLTPQGSQGSGVRVSKPSSEHSRTTSSNKMEKSGSTANKTASASQRSGSTAAASKPEVQSKSLSQEAVDEIEAADDGAADEEVEQELE